MATKKPRTVAGIAAEVQALEQADPAAWQQLVKLLAQSDEFSAEVERWSPWLLGKLKHLCGMVPVVSNEIAEAAVKASRPRKQTDESKERDAVLLAVAEELYPAGARRDWQRICDAVNERLPKLKKLRPANARVRFAQLAKRSVLKNYGSEA